MNGNSSPQQEQQRVAERVAHTETAIVYQGKAIADLNEAMKAGFARTDARFDRTDAEFVRVDAEFVRVHEQLMKIRTTDFRILMGMSLTSMLGTFALIIKMFGLLQ